jgi:ribonuclease-3 family protein
MLLGLNKPLSETEARQYSSLTLAFMGDCVFDLLVRSHLTSTYDIPVRELHLSASAWVSAQAQSASVAFIESYLTETEKEVYKRGRNAKSHSTAKNMTVCDYRRATGLETLFGFLYLTGNQERIEKLFSIIMEKKGEGIN